MEKLLINDIPLSDLGAVLAPDSYKSVLTWAKFKSLQSNDWAEYNYVEYDLAQPTLDKRTVTLNFHANGFDAYKRFLNYLLQYVYSFYTFPELGVTLRLRITTNSLKHIGDNWQSFSITYADDAPYTQVQPSLSESSIPDSGYKLDGVDLARYGISILEGTFMSLKQQSAIKERLLINENSLDGAIYDEGGTIRFKESTFTLKTLVRAVNLSTAVSNFYYLFNLLKASGVRIFEVEDMGEIIYCFYNSCNVGNVHSKLSSGMAGIQADITFTIVKRAAVTVLGTDDMTAALITESNKYLKGE